MGASFQFVVRDSPSARRDLIVATGKLRGDTGKHLDILPYCSLRLHPPLTFSPPPSSSHFLHPLLTSSPPSYFLPSLPLFLLGMLSRAKAQDATPLALMMVGSMERGESSITTDHISSSGNYYAPVGTMRHYVVYCM